MTYIITGTYRNGDAYADTADTIEQLTDTLRQLIGWVGLDGRYEIENIKVEIKE